MTKKTAEEHGIIEDAQELHALGLISHEDLNKVTARVNARDFRNRIEAVRAMSATEIKDVRQRWGLSQASLAHALGMSVASVSKWERGEIKPSGPALRVLNTLAVKGPDVFA